MPWPHNLSVADRLIGSPGPSRLKSWRRFPEAAGTAAAPQRHPRRRPLPTGLFPWQVSRDVDFGCGDVGQSGGAS